MLLVRICKWFACSLLSLYGVGIAGQNVNKMLYPSYAENTRQEIRIPSAVDGYMALKADLHTHTYFSDGSVSPEMRVDEAWKTGLDVLAITDHIEYKTNREYIRGDENVSYNLAVKRAEKRGIVLLKGTEITRKQPLYGHFNALFITDANRLKVDNPREAIVEAVRQGGFVFWNHPAWTVDTCQIYDFQAGLLNDGLVHGIEVFNNTEFYPRALRWAKERKLTMLSNSDVHTTVYANDGVHGAGCAVNCSGHRPMTILFSKDKSQESIKDALFAGRTLAYFGNHLAGEEELMTRFFWACVSTEVLFSDKKTVTYRLDNRYDIPFFLHYGKSRVVLWPDHSIDIAISRQTGGMDIKLENVFVDEFKNLVVRLSL